MKDKKISAVIIYEDKHHDIDVQLSLKKFLPFGMLEMTRQFI